MGWGDVAGETSSVPFGVATGCWAMAGMGPRAVRAARRVQRKWREAPRGWRRGSMWVFLFRISWSDLIRGAQRMLGTTPTIAPLGLRMYISLLPGAYAPGYLPSPRRGYSRLQHIPL